MPLSSPVEVLFAWPPVDEVERSEGCRRCRLVGDDDEGDEGEEGEVGDDEPFAFMWRISIEEASEPRRLLVIGMLVPILLTSTPRKLPGAHPAIAHGTPHSAITMVAKRTEFTKGAKIMAEANVAQPSFQAVSRVGFLNSPATVWRP